MATKAAFHLLLALLVLILLLGLSNCLKLESCKTLSGCTASTDQGLINLWPLASDNAVAPRFQNVWDTKRSIFLYSWNPCKSWVYKMVGNESQQLNHCTEDTSVCVTRNAGYQSYHADIGKTSTARFVLDHDTGICSLVYDGMFVFQPSVVQVELFCSSEEGRLEVFSSSNLTIHGRVDFKTRLHSKYACPIESRLSAGSILCIIFFSCLVVYLIGGIIWTKCSRGATGLEMIPHYTFWKDFFTLGQDGAMFTVFKIGSLCSGGKSAGYESI